jgi:hypothetical protein
MKAALAGQAFDRSEELLDAIATFLEKIQVSELKGIFQYWVERVRWVFRLNGDSSRQGSFRELRSGPTDCHNLRITAFGPTLQRDEIFDLHDDLTLDVEIATNTEKSSRRNSRNGPANTSFFSEGCHRRKIGSVK